MSPMIKDSEVIFCILVGRAQAPVRQVKHCRQRATSYPGRQPLPLGQSLFFSYYGSGVGAFCDQILPSSALQCADYT